MTSEFEFQSLLGAFAGLLPEITPQSGRQTGLLPPAATYFQTPMRSLDPPATVGQDKLVLEFYTRLRYTRGIGYSYITEQLP